MLLLSHVLLDLGVEPTPPLETALSVLKLTLRNNTAGIISLLTHICICVVLNILVHAQLTYGHQSPCH